MKNFIFLILSLVFAAQISLAQKGPRETAQVKERWKTAIKERSTEYKAIEKAKEEAIKNKKTFDIMKDPTLKPLVLETLNKTLKDVPDFKLDTVKQGELVKLLNVDALEVLATITQWAAAAKLKGATPVQVEQARQTLELLVAASKTVKTFVDNNPDAIKAEQAKIPRIIEVSEKVASLNLGKKSADFIVEYKKALESPLVTVEQAVRVASQKVNGKDKGFTLDELLNCKP